MFKKSISSILVLTLILLSFTSVYAAVGNAETIERTSDGFINSTAEINALVNEKKLSKETTAEIMNEIKIMEDMGLASFDLTSINISEDDINYTLQYEDIINVVSVRELADNSIELHFTEGEKEDFVVKTADGKIILNGNEVLFTEETFHEYSPLSVDESFYEYPPISLSAGFTYITTSTCPYGSASDYSHLSSTTSVANVTLGTYLRNMTAGAVVAVLAGIVLGGIGSIAAAGTALLSGAATSLIATAVTYNPNSQNLSYSATTYYHKNTKTYEINSTQKVKKIVTYWYAYKNYINHAKTTTLYTYGLWG